MERRGPGDYGDAHAPIYDRIYGPRFVPDAAVAVLAAAAGRGGRLLELGLGTGRLAIPLLARGVHVDGIEASRAMIERVRAQPGGDRLGVFQLDLAGFDLPRADYDVAVCAVSTLFMLPDRAAQQRCLDATAKHLRPGGQLFIEAFRADPTRFDAHGRREETRPVPGGTDLVRSVHDPGRQRIQITHELTDASARAIYEVTLHYAEPAELDAMATRAGLTATGHWHDWSTTAAHETSTDPISVYQK